MPCYSSVASRMVDAGRLVEALRAVGIEAAVSASGLEIRASGDKPLYRRARVGDAFATVQYFSDLGPVEAGAVGRKYAELGVRSFAKSRGFSVVSADGGKIVLKNRRG